MKESLDIRKTSGVRDSDDFFQKEREWAFAYSKNIRDACDSFNNLMFAQLRFANQVHMYNIIEVNQRQLYSDPFLHIINATEIL